ncbi:MAG: hypothetical protein WCO94_17575, partial [Verrucomicrobiota bacterium]
YGDLPYANEVEPDKGKLPHYNTQNLLARSLHPLCYENNPGFLRFIQDTGLPFEPLANFRVKQMEERCDLYLKLAEQIWNPAQLVHAATA